MGEVFEIKSSKRVLKSDWKTEGIPFYRAREIVKLSETENVDNDLFISEELYKELKKQYGVPKKGDIMISAVGTIGKPYVVKEKDIFYYKDASVLCLESGNTINSYFICLILKSEFMVEQMFSNSKGTTVETITIEKAKNYLFPLPPLQEQHRIVSKIEEIFALIDELEINKTDLQTLIKQTKTKVLDLAIRGKLLNEENALSFEEATSDNGHYNDFPFPIPKHWQWKKLSEVSNIARGGSPRPIKDFLTDEDNGINWIKIGDTEQGGKYIYSTNEKIKPEGIKYSRFVEEDNFLLTNSMSFGRPYILKTNGCIHDGWLVIKLNKEILSVDFTYYLLSSKFMFDQFSNLAVGSTVKNLKSESVQNSIIPLPPLSEQEKIVQKIEKIFSELEKIETMING